MAKDRLKGRVVKARRDVAKAENRYQTAVAKGERRIRDVRAEVEELVAHAKAEFNLKSSQLAAAELALSEKVRAKSSRKSGTTTDEPDVVENVASVGNGASRLSTLRDRKPATISNAKREAEIQTG